MKHHWASWRHESGTSTIKAIVKDKAVSLTCIRRVCPAGLPWPELTRQTHHRTLGSMLCTHLEYSQHYNFCYLFTLSALFFRSNQYFIFCLSFNYKVLANPYYVQRTEDVEIPSLSDSELWLISQHTMTEKYWGSLTWRNHFWELRLHSWPTPT